MSFRARYAGQCPGCAEGIDVGDEITDADGYYAHLECSNEEPKTETTQQACTKCWLVHNGECF